MHTEWNKAVIFLILILSSCYERKEGADVPAGSPVRAAAPAGTAILAGRVIPPAPGAEVKLVSEGRERAAVRTDSEGRYELKEIPDGTYEVRVSLPGHAEDRARVTIAGNGKVEHTAVLLPIVPLDGVDWEGGKIRATGVGFPPPDASNMTVRRAMAERAAFADGQRNLLRTIEQIRLDSGQTVRSATENRSFAGKLQGFVKNYTVVSERELEHGKIEVVLELPLTGPNGLSRYIAE
jgi:hypothetical protein